MSDRLQHLAFVVLILLGYSGLLIGLSIAFMMMNHGQRF